MSKFKQLRHGAFLLTQSEYTRDLLNRAKMAKVKDISFPSVGKCKLSMVLNMPSNLKDISFPTVHNCKIYCGGRSSIVIDTQLCRFY